MKKDKKDKHEPLFEVNRMESRGRRQKLWLFRRRIFGILFSSSVITQSGVVGLGYSVKVINNGVQL